MYAAASLNRKTVVFATSLTWPNLPSGLSFMLIAAAFVFGRRRANPSVLSIAPVKLLVACDEQISGNHTWSNDIGPDTIRAFFDSKHSRKGVNAGLGGGDVGLEWRAVVMQGGTDHDVGAFGTAYVG